MGSGGSILTVPALVFLLNINPQASTAYSLFIVGITSLVGSIQKIKEGVVNVKSALIFGIPSIISVYITRKFVVPIIPDLHLGQKVISWDILQMVLFAILMVAASYSMIKNGREPIMPTNSEQGNGANYPILVADGTVMGILTGLLGVGGGFLIIPALVVMGKLSMKTAVGTSLTIISANAIIGFLSGLKRLEIEWLFLVEFTALSILGIFIGNAIAKRVDSQKLKVSFGWFVLAMGVYILTSELMGWRMN
jgi:uncharacterized membrane protein YfcA